MFHPSSRLLSSALCGPVDSCTCLSTVAAAPLGQSNLKVRVATLLLSSTVAEQKARQKHDVRRQGGGVRGGVRRTGGRVVREGSIPCSAAEQGMERISLSYTVSHGGVATLKGQLRCNGPRLSDDFSQSRAKEQQQNQRGGRGRRGWGMGCLL